MYSNFNKKIFYIILSLVVIFSIFGLVSKSEALISGPNSPDVGADDSSIGTITWSNPGNVISSNNGYATASLDDNIISHYLKATDFDFSIPSNAVINGITVDIEKDVGSASRVKDYQVRIIKGGTVGSTNRSNTNFWSTTEAYVTYGSSSDLWGESWTYSDINNLNFGVAISAQKTVTAGGAVIASVDHIRITITYTVDSTPPTGTITLGGGATYWTTNTSPTIALTTNDAVQYQLCLNAASAGVDCTSVVRAWATYTASPAAYDFTSQGLKTLYVQFKDTAGNISATFSDSITIDTIPPTVTITSSPTINNANKSSYTVSGACSENGRTVSVVIGSLGAVTPTCTTLAWTTTNDVSSVADNAAVIITANHTDAAGNNATQASASVLKDTANPNTTIDTNPTDPAHSSSASFTFSSEVGATFECDLDSAGYSSCSSPKSYTSLSDGFHTFSVRATDTAGNTDSTPATFTWSIVTSYTLTIPASSGTGTGSYGGTAAGSIAYNTAVSITATPDASSTFTNWVATGAAAACNGTTSSPCAFNMTSAASVQAVYTIKTLTVTFDKNGGDTEADPTSKTATHGGNVGTLPTPPTRVGYDFDSWNTLANGLGSTFLATTAVTSDITVYAKWTIKTYTFTRLAKTGTGNGVYGGTTPGTINYGTSVTVTATPDSSSNFTRWNATGAASSCDGTTSSPCSFTMTADASVQAVYTLKTGTLTILASGGTGAGTYGGTTAGIYDYGTSISITATATGGSTFTNWTSSGGANSCNGSTSTTCNFSMYGDASVQANYSLVTYTFTRPAITGSGFGIYGGTSPGSIASGATVNVTATPDASSNFTSWIATGAAASCNGTTSSPCSFIMTADASVQAIFTLKSYTLTIPSSTGTGSGSYGGTPAGSVNHGTSVSITATPDASSNFTSWIATGAAASCNGTTLSPCVFSMTGAASVTAVYTLKSFTLTYSAGANGSIVGTTPQTIDYGDDGSEVVATPAIGYHFTSWSDGVLTAARTDTNVTANISVTASFAADILFTVIFDKNGGDTEADPTSKTATHGGNVGTLPTPPTRTGYTFASWNTQADGNGTLFDATTVVTADITVYAKWTANIYTLTYTAGAGGSLTGTTSQTVNYGESGTEVIAIADPGYSFIKWSDNIMTASRTDVSVTANISVTANFASSATKFVIIDPVDDTVGNDVTVRIEARDVSDVLVTTYNNTITLVASGSATGEGLVNIIDGIGTIDISDIVAETVDLSLSDTSSTGLDYTSTQDVIFSPDNLHHFIIDNISSPQTAGSEFSVTVTAKDLYGNIVPSFIEKVNLSTSTGGTISPSTSDNFTSGILTQSNIKVTESGSDKTITVTRQGGSENGTSNSFTVNPGSTYRFLLNSPSDILTGTRAGYTVTRQDQNNNLVSSGTDTVYLSASTGSFYDTAVDGNLINEIDISNPNSSSNFWYLGDTAGSKTITASDNSSPDGATGIIDADDNIIVSDTPIVATRLVISCVDSAAAGDNVTVTVEAQDDIGRVDTSYGGTVNIQASGPLPRPIPETISLGTGIVTLISGQGSIIIIDTKAEEITLSLNTPSPVLDVSSTKNIEFIPGPFSYFTMENISSPQTAGTEFGVIINAKDVNGNTATSFTGTVDFTTTAGVIDPLISNNFSAGILNQNVSVTGSGTGKTITATKTSDIQYYTSNTFDVNPGSVASFNVEASGGGNITTKTINVPFDIKITALDSFGNLATGFTGSVNITSTGTLASGGGSTSSFTDGVLNTHSVTISNSGTFTITTTRTSGTEIGVSNSFNVSPLPIVATKFIIIDPPDVQVGNYTTVTVEAVDDAGNRDDTFEGDINLVTSGSATGGGLVDIVNGVGTKNITDSTVETVTLSLSDITPPTTLNFTSTQSVVFSATPPSGGGGGGRAQVITPVISFTGRAFPLVNVEIIAIRNGQIPIGNMSKGTGTGNFNVAYNGQLPADVDTFALVVYDKDKKITQTKLFKLGVSDQLLSTIIMAPTLILNQQLVTLGTFMGLTGSGMPNYKIELMIDGLVVPETTTADAKGDYNLIFNTYRLGIGEHTLRVRQTDKQGKSSDYSIEKVFTITKSFVPKADLNNDGKVDVSDWSIFITKYKSPNTTNSVELDLNSDGVLDIKDFSYFIEALAR